MQGIVLRVIWFVETFPGKEALTTKWGLEGCGVKAVNETDNSPRLPGASKKLFFAEDKAVRLVFNNPAAPIFKEYSICLCIYNNIT